MVISTISLSINSRNKCLIDDRSRYVTPLAVCSDNGKENIANFIVSFIKQHDIYHCFTIPGNPQSNGKFEVVETS